MARSKNTERRRVHDRSSKEPGGANNVAAEAFEAKTRSAGRPLAPIVRFPVHQRPRAYELLSAQPLSLAGMSQAERDLVVVTAVADGLGKEYQVSRFADPIWVLSSESKAKNRKASQHRVIWPTDAPKSLVDDAKAALYCALRRGPLGKPWSGSSVSRTGKGLGVLLRHLTSLGICYFSQVRALHMSDYITDLKRRLAPTTIRLQLEIIDLVWHFPMEVFYPLPEHPWSGETLPGACGCNVNDGSSAARTSKTPVIPRSVQQALFAYCEAGLDNAEALFQARDAERISAQSSELTEVRDVVLYLTQITSGMRNSESTCVTNDCWRSEVVRGVTFHWVRTYEAKTGKGFVEYLVPPETVRALTILQRYAAPLQARLAAEARWLRTQLRRVSDETGVLENGMTVADAVERLNHIREIRHHMFLGLDKRRTDHLGSGSRVEVMSVEACNAQLKSLAVSAGVDWPLANHQCRRTFAYNVANSRLGRMGLVFVMWQLKHSSMSWSELYASNPHQDVALYRELEDERIEARLELMEGWMQSDAPLSGGAGRKIMQTRATPVRSINDLLLHTAEAVDIRSTGHAWCLSGTEGCHGQGVYDPAMCGRCSHGVIDRDQATTWQMIHLDNLRLAAITDCGPAVVQKAQRAIRRSESVLSDLCVPLPSAAQAAAYANSGQFS